MSDEKKKAGILLMLAVCALAAFWPATACEFINFDDDQYVTENPMVRQGITSAGVRWAFSTFHAANWHPLTWLSHMLDVQLFGLDPKWHHATSLLVHAATSLLLFLVLSRMTRALWQSALVAALFALHPLRVESVAWVAERKDVLSAFFWVLTMGAYAIYVERPRAGRYWPVLGAFALGLMAKPMLVTLPCVLLLLDVWPLRRLQPFPPAVPGGGGTGAAAPHSMNRRKPPNIHGSARPDRDKGVPHSANEPERRRPGVRFLLMEKVPLFALVVVAGALTYMAQQQGGAVRTVQEFPLDVRIAHAFVSYVLYLWKMMWPVDLAVLYPHHGLGPLWQVVGAIGLLSAVTAGVVRLMSRFPYLATGWLWYLGTLVPVIGLVQVGTHAYADRYTYLPSVGISIMLVWGIADIARSQRLPGWAIAALSAVVLTALIGMTRMQTGFWRNSISLYTHALGITERNALVLSNRGMAYEKSGDLPKAIDDYDEAISIAPDFAFAYCNRGVAHDRLEHHPQALQDYDRAIALNPTYAQAYSNRGVVHEKLGNDSQASRDYDRALELNPRLAMAYFNRGVMRERTGDYGQAVEEYDRALQVDPTYAKASFNQGIVYSRMGKLREAIGSFDATLAAQPGHEGAFYNRGIVKGMLGSYGEAIADLGRALELNPRLAQAYYFRGLAFDKLGDKNRALADMKTAASLGLRQARDHTAGLPATAP